MTAVTAASSAANMTATSTHYTVAGVVADFEMLFTRFSATKSVRYEHFLEVWKEMHMSFIFAGRQTDRECREFTEECMKLALPYCLPPYQFQVRVCGLYLLYAIYFKYPFHPRVKIRVTLSDWRELLALLADIHEQRHLDVEYVFTRLRYDRAFHFVAYKTEVYPGMRDASAGISNDTQQQKLEALIEQKSIVSELFESDTIDQLAAIHEEYHRVKCALSGSKASRPEQSLNVIENGLIQVLTKAVTAHEDWRKTKVGKKLAGRRRRNSGHTSESEVESEAESDAAGSVCKSQGAIRAEIKARAFSSSAAQSASRRYCRPNEVSNTDPVAETSAAGLASPPGKGKRRKRKISDSEDINATSQNVVVVSPSACTGDVVSMPSLATDEPSDGEHPKKLSGNKRRKMEKAKRKKENAKKKMSAKDTCSCPSRQRVESTDNNQQRSPRKTAQTSDNPSDQIAGRVEAIEIVPLLDSDGLEKSGKEKDLTMKNVGSEEGTSGKSAKKKKMVTAAEEMSGTPTKSAQKESPAKGTEAANDARTERVDNVTENQTKTKEVSADDDDVIIIGVSSVLQKPSIKKKKQPAKKSKGKDTSVQEKQGGDEAAGKIVKKLVKKKKKKVQSKTTTEDQSVAPGPTELTRNETSVELVKEKEESTAESPLKVTCIPFPMTPKKGKRKSGPSDTTEDEEMVSSQTAKELMETVVLVKKLSEQRGSVPDKSPEKSRRNATPLKEPTVQNAASATVLSERDTPTPKKRTELEPAKKSAKKTPKTKGPDNCESPNVKNASVESATAAMDLTVSKKGKPVPKKLSKSPTLASNDKSQDKEKGATLVADADSKTVGENSGRVELTCSKKANVMPEISAKTPTPASNKKSKDNENDAVQVADSDIETISGKSRKNVNKKKGHPATPAK